MDIIENEPKDKESLEEAKTDQEENNSVEIEKLRETLEKEIKNSSCVFITGHTEPDFDSIGSCLGLQLIASHLGKEAYIIVDDNPITIEPGSKVLIDANRESSHIITKEEFKQLQRPNSLLIVTDTNKYYKVSVSDHLYEFRSVIVIDHHEKDEATIPTPYLFIKENSSSCSEIVTQLLEQMGIDCSQEIANALFAGISLDTKRFFRSGKKTHGIAQYLKDHNATEEYIKDLFLEDFVTGKRIAKLVFDYVSFKEYGDPMSPIIVAFTQDRDNPYQIYHKEDLAKAADDLIGFRGIDASFSLGFLEEGRVHMSARGSEKVNVVEIVTKLPGQLGGKRLSAGGSVFTNDIQKVEQDLIHVCDEQFETGIHTDIHKQKVYTNQEKS